MISEEYDFNPANHACTSQINKPIIVTTPGTSTEANQMAVNGVEQQNNENAKYDNVDSIDVKPLYGGKNNKNKQKQIKKNSNKQINNKQNKVNNKQLKKDKYYTINHNNKILKYKAINEKDVIKQFLNKNNLKKDYLLEICECKKKNPKDFLYLIKKN